MLFVSKRTSQASVRAVPPARTGATTECCPSLSRGHRLHLAGDRRRTLEQSHFVYHASATAARGCECIALAPTEPFGYEWDATRHVCGFCEECHGAKGPGTRKRRLTCQGHLGPYEELVAQFQVGTLSKPTSTEGTSSASLLHSWIVALTHVAPLLDRSCATLVDAVTEFPWLAMPPDVGDAWAHLVCAIVSARSEWVTRVVSLLFQNMGLCTLLPLTPQT